MNDTTVIREEVDSESFVHIGPWIVDADRCELRCGEHVVDVSSRAMTLLLCFVQRCGEVVGIDDLRAQISKLHNGNGNGVYKYISELRRALGDDPRHPTYIQTVHKRGYRLIADRMTADDAPEESDGSSVSRGQAYLFRHGAHTTLLLSLALLATVAVFSYVSHDGRETIAVLQFENIDGDPANDTLASMMSEAVYRYLSTAKTCYPYLATNLPMELSDATREQIGTALAVDHVLSGSVQTDGELLRASAEVVRVHDGAILYSVQIDRSIHSLGGFEGELARRVARASAIVLNETGRRDLREGGTASADAMLLMLDGNHYRSQSSHSSLRLASEHYRKALALDPNFVLAYLNLASTLGQIAQTTFDASERSEIRQEVARIHKTVSEIDPDSRYLHSIALTESRLTYPDLFDVEAQLREQIRSDPADVGAYNMYASILLSGGLYKEARAYHMRYREVYPDAPPRADMVLLEGDPYRYVSLLRQTLSPNAIPSLTALVNQLARIGEFDEARSYLNHLEAIDEDGVYAYGAALRLRAFRGELPLGSAALEEALDDPRASVMAKGSVYFILGDVDSGVSFWRQLHASQAQPIRHLESLFPQWIRADTRYEAVLEEIGIGRSWTQYLRDRVAELAATTGIQSASGSDL